MLTSIRKYFSIYQSFLSTSIAQASSFRAHFALLVIMDLVFYASALASIDFIFNHVGQIGPWGRQEFLFFVAFMLTIDQLHMTFISENFWEFSYNLRMGNLDFTLLKPVGSIFIVFFRFFRPSSSVNIVVTLSCLVYFGIQAEVPPLMWLIMPLLIALGLTLLVSVEILISMLMFLTIESFGINFLRMQLQALARYPDFIYKLMARRFFTIVLPILLVGSAPVQFIFDHSKWGLLVGAVFAVGVMSLLIRFFWRRGLRGYESASS